MKITSVKVRIICNEKLKASISIVVDEALFVDRINVIYDNQKNRTFLAMPSIVKGIGKQQDVFYPINKESRKLIEDFLMQFYEYANTNQKNQIEMVLKRNCWETCIQRQSLADFKEENDKTNNVDEDEQIFSITSFRIRTIDSMTSLCAIASFVIDYTFAVHNLKIVLDKYTNDYKLIMPQYETKTHSKKDLIHPVNRALRGKLEEILLGSYKVLSDKKMNELNASVSEGKDISLYLQKNSDFNYEYIEGARTSKEPIFSEKNYIVADMTESLDEKIYRDSGCAISEIIRKKNRNYKSGKIIGYIADNYYKVALSNGEIGKIECRLMDSLYKVLDYRNQVFSRFVFYGNENPEEYFLKHINREYYFEIIDETIGTEHLLSIENVRNDYLNYVIEHKCILRGKIIQIANEYVGIEIPFGYVFFTSINFVFGCMYDLMFDYMNYLGAEISVIIQYDENLNKIYPIIANRSFNILEPNANYIFPALTIWEKTYYSKLWLDRRLLLLDKNKKYPLKHINQLVVVGNIREKGEMKKAYKGNIKKIFSEKDAPTIRKSILAVEWIINLRGHNIENAIGYLKRKGFPYTIQYTYSFYKNSGIILSMCPNVEEKMILPRNVIIQLTVSQGKRKEYILPNFIGMHIKDVRDILKKNNICLKYEISNSKHETIGDNCIIQTWPAAGKLVLSGKTVNVKIYQEKIYESPFALRENEYIRINHNGKMVGSEAIIDQFISVKWQKEMLIFILKHKIANSIQLKWWIDMNFSADDLRCDIDGSLKYLQTFSMISSLTLRTDISESNMHYFFPRKTLYPAFKSFAGYNGIFSYYGKDARYYKTRAAENQAFLRLYSILKDNSIIKYEVDCIQSFMYDSLQQFLRVHIAVNATSKLKKHTDIYFIEAIRFINDDQLIEGWNKLFRYNIYINKEYEIVPNLVLVFEDEMHYKEFMIKRPDEFRLKYIKLFYTWDSLTNKNCDKFDEIFTKEDTLC